MSGPDAKPRIVVAADDVRRRIGEIAAAIAAGGARELTVVPILLGAMFFGADLARALGQRGIGVTVDYLQLKSYGAGTRSSGTVKLLRDLSGEVRDRDVLLVDGVADTGRTLAFARDLVARKGAASVATAVLVDKPAHREVAVAVDHAGFRLDGVFVVGMGMDHAGNWRELPYLGAVDV